MRFAGWWRGTGRLPALMVTALLLLAPAMGPAAESSPGRGFVASFGAVPARDGRLPLQALAVTDSAPGSMARQRDAATDWQVRWIDEDGRSLADARVPDPRRPLLGSSDARQPLALRFADHRDAVLVEVRDAAGVLRGEVPLDAGSRVRADTAAEAVKDRLAAASRRTAKRDGRPAAADAAIRATFQVDVQQRVDALRDVRCSPARMGFRIPEQVVADPCRAGDADVGSEPRPAAVPPRLAGPRKPRAASTGIPRLAVSGLPRAAATNPLSGPSPSGSPRDPSFPTVRRPAEPVGPLFDVGPRRATQPPPGGFAVAKRPHRERVSETVTLTGRVLFPAGAPAPTTPVTLYSWGAPGNSSGYVLTAHPPTFAFSSPVLAGAEVDLEVRAPVPFQSTTIPLGVIVTDTVHDVRLSRGVHIRGSVGGPAQYTVQIQDRVAGGWPRQFPFSTPDFEVAAAPVGGSVEVAATGFFPSEVFLPQHGADADVDFVLRARPGSTNVTLTLHDPSGQPLSNARAEAWAAGRYFTSAQGDPSGTARLELPTGEFEIRVWPDTEAANQWSWQTTRLFAEPAIRTALSVDGPTAATLTVPVHEWNTMRLTLPTETAQPGCGGPPVGRLELVRDGRVVARGNFRDLYPYAGGGHRLITGAGAYTLRYVMPGEVRYETEPFHAAEGRTLSFRRVGSAPQRLWTGTLRDHAGAPVPNRDIRISDELGITLYPACPVRTDAAGAFRVALCEGCVYSFQASADDPSQRRTVRIGTPVTANRVEDMRLGRPLGFAPLGESGTTRVFGHPDAAFRLIFLAEGYVAERETFTDANGNGVWDGIQWIDVNGDGLWNEGEPTAQYGVAAWPTEGSDPRTTNEPFEDLNGDGVLSIDDRALFERNVRDYLRGLFSSDQFSAYRHAYQASALMTYSAQAGMDHGSFTRETLFGARYEPARALISIDYQAAHVAAANADPDYNVIVVMINQPVPYGRVNSFILAAGGVLGGNVNDNVAAHEFGHNPGGLADEYAEFPGAYIGADIGSPNSSRFVERDLVAWGGGVDPELDGRPTKPWFAPDGFFEGSSYQSAGAFRPSHASMMRFIDSLMFNDASVAQLARVHARALRHLPGRLEVSGEQRGCRTYLATWDVAALGVAAVELRGDAHDGVKLGAGGAAGSAWVKPFGHDLYLVDAAEGLVLDIAPVPILRCIPPTENE